MMSNFETCQTCGVKYQDFRTGLDFRTVREMMWVASDDTRDWKYKRRNGVLGYWRMIKLAMWNEHMVSCNCEQIDAITDYGIDDY